MKKVVIICDHYPVSPRLIKVKDTLQSKDYDVYVVAWNRSGYDVNESALQKNEYVFTSNAKYGNRILKLINLIPFKMWVNKVLKTIKPDIIHAIDFEILYLVKNKKSSIVYEVYDIKYFANKYINKLREMLEIYALKRVELVIYASPFFNEYYKTDKKFVVINNKPRKKDIGNFDNEQNDRSLGAIEIGFVGSVRYYDILEKIIFLIGKDDSFNFHIHGSGPDYAKINSLIKKKKLTNVFAHGRYETRDLPSIYSSLDYIWACYPPNDYNVKLAVSNKFFEAQYFKRKIIISKNTKIGSLVENEDIGYAVDPNNIDDLIKILENIKKEKTHTLAKEYLLPNTTGNLWEDEEADLLESYPK